MTTQYQATANDSLHPTTANVRRRFGDRTVLAGAELTIRPGEFVALLGRSGTGKSTLLRILAGLDNDYDGHIHVPRKVSVVFQDARLLPWLRVLPNVTIGLRRSTGIARAAAAALGAAALAEVGLTDHMHAWPGTLSGGEAQRVALARALVREPELLLLDEPFGALDALTRARMHTLLRGLCQRHHPSVLLVTHDVDEALELADRALVLHDGRIALNLPIARDLDDDETIGLPALRARLLRSLGS